MRAVIELARPASKDPEEYDVQFLQVGGPRESGVLNGLFGRVVRCPPGAVSEQSFNGDAVPTSPDVWERALLVAAWGQVLAFAVATDRAALEHSLRKFSARCTGVDDYDDVAYHFLGEVANHTGETREPPAGGSSFLARALLRSCRSGVIT